MKILEKLKELIIKYEGLKGIEHPRLDEILIHPKNYQELILELTKMHCFLTPRLPDMNETFMGKLITPDTTFAQDGIVLFGTRKFGYVYFKEQYLTEVKQR